MGYGLKFNFDAKLDADLVNPLCEHALNTNVFFAFERCHPIWSRSEPIFGLVYAPVNGSTAGKQGIHYQMPNPCCEHNMLHILGKVHLLSMGGAAILLLSAGPITNTLKDKMAAFKIC